MWRKKGVKINVEWLKLKMMKPSQMPDYQVFTYWHVFFLVGAILTYFVDLVLGEVFLFIC